MFMYVLHIVCQNGDIRLVEVGGASSYRVEVCVNNTYGAVCDRFWDKMDALVACRQLGYSNGILKLLDEGCFIFRVIGIYF